MPIINFLLNYPWCFCFCLQTLPDTRSQYTYAKSILKDSCSLKEKLWQTSVQFSSVQSDNPRQHIKKQSNYFVSKDPSSQSYGFSTNHVWMWESDIKKAKHQRIDVFELWCWRRLLRVPWTARRSNQSILKETNPECLLEGIMLKQKLQYFGHLMGDLIHLKSPWYWERLEAEREGNNRGWDGWMASLTQLTWVWVDSGSSWWTGRPGVLRFMGLQRVGHDWATELYWTDSGPPRNSRD